MAIKNENEFAKNLKLTMSILNLKQEDVAKAIGVSRQAISQYINGETFPTVEKIILLCNYYSLDANILLGINCDDRKELYTKMLCSKITDFLKTI